MELHLHDATYIALTGTYDFREQIKALADWPDVKFNRELSAWLVHGALLEKLFATLGEHIAPLTPEVACALPVPQPTPAPVRRRTKREILAKKAQDKAAAGKWGKAIVEMKVAR